MLKILEKNSALETVRKYWKLFEAWATDLHNRYWRDIFFRTELNVIALQIAFAIIISVTIIVFFNYLYQNILQTVLSGLTQYVQTNGAVTGQDIVNSIEVAKDKSFFMFFGVAMCLTLLFSYVIAKATLSPTRNALKSQKRFISDVAHELRTPISIIKTNNEVALLDDGFDRKTRVIFKDTIEELNRVSVIINNLLTFNNLVHPEPTKFAYVNMGQVIDASIDKLDELIRSKNVKIIVKKTAPYVVWGNVVALEQIVINLVKNAVVYNKEGGTVTIRVEPDYRGNIVLCVEDNGIGIHQDDLFHIFEPFFRAERSRKRQAGSSGLGLAIVSELVKLHSGKVSVTSRLRQGTTVQVQFPYVAQNDGKEEVKESVIYQK